MNIVKGIFLILAFLSSLWIGRLISAKYKNRVRDLKEMKNALNIFRTKMKFTYEPIPEIFHELSKTLNENISSIFLKAYENMESDNAGKSWETAINSSITNMNKEDIDILKGLSKLLGKTDIEGQLAEIDLTSNFLDMQIKKAEVECDKNVKLYKNLGVVMRTYTSNYINLINT